ncbi:hypothetical protein SUGI_0937860 [Cryptomeria japonica]|nr:hypothetical protein SUGI_0937860 [Cryptomeria japonica]
MEFRIMSPLLCLKMIVLLLLIRKTTNDCTPVLAAGGDSDSILQEPTVPLLSYLRVYKFQKMLSNSQTYEGWHDEIDIEFLGTIPGEPYKLQTNVYGNSTGDGNLIGREQQFHLWFNPTQDFHNYSILWTPSQVLFLVDVIPIRRFPKTKSLGVIYPSKPMSKYARIWDASSWARDGGKYKASYTYESFLSSYTNSQTIGCHDKDNYCSKVLLDGCLVSPHLNKKQIVDLKYVRKNYMTYDYCQDLQPYPKGSMPECPTQPSDSY